MSKLAIADITIGSRWVSCGETCQVLEHLDDGWVRVRELTGPLKGNVYDVHPKNYLKLWTPAAPANG